MSNDQLSQEATKARDEAQERARLFAPTLARTKAVAVILRPSAHENGQAARKFSTWVTASLPAFSFNSKHGYWQAPLNQITQAHATLTAGGRFCNVTDGARAELDKAHTALDPRQDWPTVDVDFPSNPRRITITRPEQANSTAGNFDVFMHSYLPWFLVSPHGDWRADPCEIKQAVRVFAKRLGGCNLTPAAQTYLEELSQ